MSYYMIPKQESPVGTAWGLVGSALSGAMEARKVEDLAMLEQRLLVLQDTVKQLRAVSEPVVKNAA